MKPSDTLIFLSCEQWSGLRRPTLKGSRKIPSALLYNSEIPIFKRGTVHESGTSHRNASLPWLKNTRVPPGAFGGNVVPGPHTTHRNFIWVWTRCQDFNSSPSTSHAFQLEPWIGSPALECRAVGRIRFLKKSLTVKTTRWHNFSFERNKIEKKMSSEFHPAPLQVELTGYGLRSRKSEAQLSRFTGFN